MQILMHSSLVSYEALDLKRKMTDAVESLQTLTLEAKFYTVRCNEFIVKVDEGWVTKVNARFKRIRK